MYWAFQTLTTVGYGDFPLTSIPELIFGVAWMLVGVIFYSIIVGSLTSIFSQEIFTAERLEDKLKVLENFQDSYHIEEDLYQRIRLFFQNNYDDITNKLDEDALINQLPFTLKEDILFHQYGGVI